MRVLKVIELANKIQKTLVVCLVGLIAVSSVDAQDEIPTNRFEAIAWLENSRNTVKKNEKGEVVEIVIDYVPSIFVVGDLDVFPKLETLKINYTGSFYDSHMSGIARLKSLKKFDADYCDEISEASLSVLQYLPKLEEVRLRNCEAVYSLKQLARCKTLKKIDLTYNEHLDFDVLLNLKDLPALESIVLSDNPNLEDRHLRWLGRIPNLKEIELEGCKGITDEGIRELSALQLTKLDLSENKQLSGETLDSLNGANMTELDLSSCSVTDESLLKLEGFRSLKKLNIRNNEKLDGKGVSVFENFRQLEVLDLDGLRINNDHLRGMAGIKTLKKISMNGCSKVSGPGLACLVDSTGVEYVSLKGCGRVDSDDMQYVSKFANLKYLNLTGTKIKPEGIRLLQRCKSLEKIILSECNWVDDEALRLVSEMKGLKHVTLYEVPRMTDAGIGYLGALPELIELRVSKHRDLRMDGLSSFPDSTKLKKLYIEKLPKLSSTGLANLKRFKKLTSLDILQKSISIEQLSALQGARSIIDLDIEGDMNHDMYQQLKRSLPKLPEYDY